MAFHLSSQQRSAAAIKAAQTRKANGTQHNNAAKAAATRRAHGIKPFGGKGHHGWKLSAGTRSSNARKAAATRKARGIKTGFARMSHAQRSAMAHKAAATRKAHGLKPFGNMTAAQRSARAKKAAATRAIMHPAKAHTSHAPKATVRHARSLSGHGKLHAVRRSHFTRQPRAHAMNPLTVRPKRTPKAVHIRRKSRYDRHKRVIL